jgi:hypothetical protein
MRVVTIDIDGILNNYPDCWLDYIAQETGQRFSSMKEAKSVLPEDEYKKIKSRYRTSGYKRTLPVNPGAVEVTRKLREKGFRIIVATSRPFADYPGLQELTRGWLEDNNISFDDLEKKGPAILDKYPQLEFHIDDELDHCEFLLARNIPVYIVKRRDLSYQPQDHHRTLTFLDRIEDVMSKIQ